MTANVSEIPVMPRRPAQPPGEAAPCSAPSERVGESPPLSTPRGLCPAALAGGGGGGGAQLCIQRWLGLAPVSPVGRRRGAFLVLTLEIYS